MLSSLARYFSQRYDHLVQRNNRERADLPSTRGPVSWGDKVAAAIQLSVMPLVALACMLLGWHIGGVGGVLLIGLLGIPLGHMAGWLVGHLLVALIQQATWGMALLVALAAIGGGIALLALVFKSLWGLGLR